MPENTKTAKPKREYAVSSVLADGKKAEVSFTVSGTYSENGRQGEFRGTVTITAYPDDGDIACITGLVVNGKAAGGRHTTERDNAIAKGVLEYVARGRFGVKWSSLRKLLVTREVTPSEDGRAGRAVDTSSYGRGSGWRVVAEAKKKEK